VPPGSPDYCSPGGGQCVMAGPGGTIEDCTADLPGTVAHDWYCTLPCSKPEDCSGGSSCTFTPMGSRCVPKSCDYLIPDSEAPTESGSEAAAEGGVPDSSVDARMDSGAADGRSRDAHD
jgi:hypothetical protein